MDIPNENHIVHVRAKLDKSCDIYKISVSHHYHYLSHFALSCIGRNFQVQFFLPIVNAILEADKTNWHVHFLENGICRVIRICHRSVNHLRQGLTKTVNFFFFLTFDKYLI